MYRKRNQLMGLAVCLVDAAVVLFSLLAAGILRYRTIEFLCMAEDMNLLCSMSILLHVTAFYFLKVYDGIFKRGRYAEFRLSIK